MVTGSFRRWCRTVIHFEFDRDADVDGTCDMVVITPELREDMDGIRDDHPPEAECNEPAVVKFTEDGEPRQFCLEHGQQRVGNLATSDVIWDVYAAD